MNELQIWICQENIQRFHDQLHKALDETRRQTIIKLLAKEQDALRQFTLARSVDHDPPQGAEKDAVAISWR